MKLIFWLLLGSFHLIYGNNEPPSTIIVREHEEKWNNSVYSFVNCAMSAVKALLETVYQDNVKKAVVPPWNKTAFQDCKSYTSFVVEHSDQYLLILQEAKWTEQFNNRSRANETHKMVYLEDVLRYTKGWLRYFFTEEAKELIKLIETESTTIENGCSLFLRFSVNMARLFKVACVTCYNLLPILRKRSMEERTKTFINHLRDLVPEWSITGEQIYFFNKLMEFALPNYQASHGLLGYEFGTINITESKNVTFFLPYTSESCGLLGNEATRNFLTYGN